MHENEQSEFWSKDFGNEYSERNNLDQEGLDKLYIDYFGISRTELNREFISNFDKSMKILEVGCNTGMQLLNLKTLGFGNLSGIDLSKAGLKTAKKNLPEANLIEASALDIPFKDGYFDLVFTSGVLIHIHPENVGKAVDEIYKLSKKYIWGYEYFSEKCEEIEYRGHKNRLWKNNFMKIFLERHPDLKIIREKKLKYKSSGNVDHMFLLKKGD
ncbi:hypothetical protein AUJ84_02070 [Candidatus Pacearchaeota archaeon CG1_02_32_132]|nr:MAG: hypothetical protein AUJ84_02070 [Candidatus Pacearchaeota archaeon CG1_02_32_132]